MRRLLAGALALSAIATAHAAAAAARLPVPAPRALAPTDGPARRAQAKQPRRGGAGAKTKATAPAAPLPAVTEIDQEGLRKLLRRGGDPAQARPLLVNFWATWCEPCRKEFPDLVKIDADYRPRGLDFVTVSGDEIAEIKTGVPKFLREMRATMPAYLLNAVDTAEAITMVDAAWGGDLPATYLFDREGKIAYKHFGPVKPDELRAALDKVLK